MKIEHQNAWDELLDATPPGCTSASRATTTRAASGMYAFDPSERPVVGKRSREWTAIGPTEEAVVREMARCLREIGAGRVPR